jgi:hypothetical protein
LTSLHQMSEISTSAYAVGTSPDKPVDRPVVEAKSGSPLGFVEEVVATNIPDGYWLEAFPFSVNDQSPPDLIGYGLGLLDKKGEVRLYYNPKGRQVEKGTSKIKANWPATMIQELDFPVALCYADLTGNGFNDVIICDHYGPSMDTLWDAQTQNGGRVIWLRNPGRRGLGLQYWEINHIGNSTGMHRLQVGHFTTKNTIQVMAIPVIRSAGDRTSPAPIIIYTPQYGSDRSAGPISWRSEIAFNSTFRLIHDVVVVHPDDGGLDQALVAGREGTSLIWHDSLGWQHNNIGEGIRRQGSNPYWGSGSVDLGKTKDDTAAYIATAEAFHGNLVVVYVKRRRARKGTQSLKDSSLWTRFVIDNFGPVDPEQYTGTIHHVACGDFDGDGVDSFVISCMGAPIGKPENQGVYLYKPINLATGEFAKYKISGESAGRVALADFEGRGQLSAASISYYVPNYHTGPDPPGIRLTIPRTEEDLRITATGSAQEPVIRVPRPHVLSVLKTTASISLLEVAGKRLWIMVIPPKHKVTLASHDGVKVLYGKVIINNPKGGEVRGVAPAAHTQATTLLNSSNGSITGGDDGAVIMRIEHLSNEFQGPFTSMSQVKTRNAFPPSIGNDVASMHFPFIAVEQLDWAAKPPLWDDFQFNNMTGFHLHFNDDLLQEICHIQLWTLGIGETARFHNHYEKSFCEIHMCLKNGGGRGGMRYFPDDYTEKIDVKKELTKEYVEKNSTLIVVPDMAEHGPLWKIKPGTQATPVIRDNGTVDYPWHAWLASEFGNHTLPINPPLGTDKQRYDIWLAFEFPESAFQY